MLSSDGSSEERLRPPSGFSRADSVSLPPALCSNRGDRMSVLLDILLGLDSGEEGEESVAVEMEGGFALRRDW